MTSKMERNTNAGPMAHAAKRKRLRQPRFAAFLALGSFAMICCILSLAGYTSVPQITRAPGTILPFGDYQQVDTLHGGIVRAVHVHDGQRVKSGDLLVELANPDLLQETELLTEQLAAIARDLKSGKVVLSMLTRPQPPSSDELDALDQSGLTTAASRLRLFFESQKIQQSSLEQQAETVQILKRASEFSKGRVERKEKGLARYAQLHAQGLKSLSDYLEEEDEVDVLRATASAAEARLAEAQNALMNSTAAMYEEALAMQDEVVTRISELEQEHDRLQVSFSNVTAKLQALRIVAPSSGVVQSVAYPNPGEVIAPGETIFEILPSRQALVVEARIPNSEVGHVNVDDPVSVSVDTFDVRRFGKVKAHLSSVYPLPLTDETTGDTYFRASFDLTDAHVGTGAFERPLRAGMTVVAELQTGEQSLLAYLLKPVQATLERAFTER